MRTFLGGSYRGRSSHALLLLCATAVAIGVITSLPDTGIEQLLISAIVLVTAIPIVVRLIQGALDPFEPTVCFALAWFVMFIARPVAMLVTGTFRTAEGAYQVRAGFVGMLVLALLGAIGFVIGYGLPLGKRWGQSLAPLPAKWRQPQAVGTAIAVAGIGIALYAVFVHEVGGFAAIPQIVGGRLEIAQLLNQSSASAYFSNGLVRVVPAAMLLLATRGGTGRHGGLTTLALLMLAIGLAALGPEGIRSWLIVFLGAPLVLWYLRRMRRPSLATTLILAFLGFTVIISFVGSARTSSLRDRAGISNLLAGSFTNLGASWNNFILGWDTDMASLLALEVTVVPSQIPYQYGSATGETVLQPIPRALWPDKPRPGDEVLTRRYFIDPGFDAAPRQYSPLADFYLDFGYVGGLIGMALLGILGRLHFEYFKSHLDNAGVQALYATTLPFWIVLMRGSVADTFGRLAFIVPPLLLCLYFARRKAASKVREGDRQLAFRATLGKASPNS